MELSDLGRRVEARRAELGLTKDEIQRRMRTNANTYYRMLSEDQGNISLQMFKRLANELDIPLEYLLSGDPAYLAPSEPPGIHAKLDTILGVLKSSTSDQIPAPIEMPASNSLDVGLWGRVAAGYGAPNESRVEPRESIAVPSRLKPTDGTLMGLEVRGDSMEPEVCNGDVVIVWYPTKQPALKLLDNGALVVITTEGSGEEYEDYLKRYWLDEETGKDMLISSNPAYEPIPIPSQPKYVGLVKMVIKM